MSSKQQNCSPDAVTKAPCIMHNAVGLGFAYYAPDICSRIFRSSQRNSGNCRMSRTSRTCHYNSFNNLISIRFLHASTFPRFSVYEDWIYHVASSDVIYRSYLLLLLSFFVFSFPETGYPWLIIMSGQIPCGPIRHEIKWPTWDNTLP